MHNISYLDLVWIFIPLSIVYYIYYKWSGDTTSIPYSLIRMVVQLIALGYFLTYIFETKNFFVLLSILLIMLIVASVISLRPITNKSKLLYLKSFISISIGGIVTLLFVIGGVLDIKLWLEPRFVIPIAGMIFANSMNSVSIAAERFESEYNKSKELIVSRNIAYKSSLIPNINTLFAVGLVAIPGMMTGQILSGIDPMIAVNYQIMVMCMVILGGGISSAIYLKLVS
jgi:putative ABC transport system permease protein